MKKLNYLLIALCIAGCQAASDITPEATPLLHTKASSLEFSRTEILQTVRLPIGAMFRTLRNRLQQNLKIPHLIRSRQLPQCLSLQHWQMIP